MTQKTMRKRDFDKAMIRHFGFMPSQRYFLTYLKIVIAQRQRRLNK